MESKPSRSCGYPVSRIPFNRTSMESKHYLVDDINEVINLLIEPVWNRNLLRLCLAFEVCQLLIEPVWNRNRAGRTSEAKPLFGLLIEPVWNRNFVTFFSSWIFQMWTFNRTSMESKHAWSKTHTGTACLLIEPVWNRNLSSRGWMKSTTDF